MGQCVIKIKHDACGSGNGLQVFAAEDGSLNGYCFACETKVNDPLGGKKLDDIPVEQRLAKTPEEIAEEMSEIGGLKAIDLKERRLRGEDLEFFGVKVGMSYKDGKTPRLVFFPREKEGEITGYKTRLLGEKGMWSVGDSKDTDPFGWAVAIASGAKRLIITEGEYDAVALKAIFRMYTPDKYVDYIPAIISLQNGSGCAKRDIGRKLAEIQATFKEISLCFDDDKAGKKAERDVLAMLPSAKVIKLPCKDANDCILEGKGKEAWKAAQFNPQVAKNSTLVFGDDIHEVARVPATYGDLTWPWPTLNELTRAIRYGETIYIGAGVKMGKSEILNAIAAHFIREHGVKVFMAKPEEANNKTYKLVAGKIFGNVFHDPKVVFDEAAYDRAGDVLRGHLAMVNLYQHMGYQTLRQDIIQAAGWGAKAVFIDPITNLTNGMESAEANIVLQAAAQDLAALAMEQDIVVFLFCHLKAPEKGKPHEMGGKIFSSQFAGSRAMMRSCNYMFGLEGNKDPELSPEERHIRHMCLLEDREFGEVGEVPLIWNERTHMMLEA